MNSISQIFQLTRLLVAVVLIWQSLEVLTLRRSLSAAGVWSWKRLRADFENHRKCQKLFDFLFQDPNFLTLVLLQLLLAGGLLLSSAVNYLADSSASTAMDSPLWLILPLFLIRWLIAIRFRGKYCGGSDSMLLILLLAILVASVDVNNLNLAKAALLFVSLQSLLSYVLAGWAKIKHHQWRTGASLKFCLQQSVYDLPASIRTLQKYPPLMMAAAWFLMLFELSFVALPISGLNPLLWVGVGFTFHFLNFTALGLNHFFWVWLATYPSLWLWQVIF